MEVQECQWKWLVKLESSLSCYDTQVATSVALEHQHDSLPISNTWRKRRKNCLNSPSSSSHSHFKLVQSFSDSLFFNWRSNRLRVPFQKPG